MSATYKDIGVSNEGHVGIVEIQRPPHNFFDNSLINQIADAFEAFAETGDVDQAGQERRLRETLAAEGVAPESIKGEIARIMDVLTPC